MEITYKLINTGERAPVYHRYPNQIKEQGAFIEIDPENGVVEAGHDPEIGGATPMDVWHNRRLRYWITPFSSAEQLNDVFNDPEFQNLVQQLINGYSVDWNGNNHIGTLDSDGSEAEDKIIDYLDRTIPEGNVEVWDAEEMYDCVTYYRIDEGYISVDDYAVKADTPDKILETLAEQMDNGTQINASNPGTVLVIEGTEEYLTELRDKLREYAACTTEDE